MNVLILGFRDANPFFDEIEKESSTHFTYGTIQDFNTNYDAILIHWPEKIFNWKEPSIRDLDTFTTFLKTRKQENCPIVHCFHNERRHYGMTSNFETLYKLVWTYADVFIHFGSYSKMKYEKMYPEKVHEVIPHPLYLNSFSKISKTIGRKHLEISEKSKVIYIAGKLRKKAERDFILKAFDKLDVEDKLFLGHILLKNKFPIDLSARIGLRKLLSPIKKVYEYCANFYLRKKLASEDIKFLETPVNTKVISNCVAASDVVLIPRLDSLNSGSIYLGFTFNKMVVGPAIGNMKEILEKTGAYSFNPENINLLVNTLKEALNVNEPNYGVNLEAMYPKNVAKKWDELFVNLKQ